MDDVLASLPYTGAFRAPRARSPRTRLVSPRRRCARSAPTRACSSPGGVAYYTLLSIVPLMILLVIILSHVIEADRLMATLARYLEIVLPGQSQPLVEELRSFISHREVMGLTLAVTLVFFSSLAFSVLENAMSVIFYHRVLAKRRRAIVSVLIPYLYILFLGIGLLMVTIVAGALQSMGMTTLDFLGRDWSLSGVSRVLLYLIGVGGEVLVLASIYFVMPVGRLSWRHALIGGVSATVLWEISRHVLVWYLATLSQVRTVYGSLTTAIIVLLTLEIAAIVLLFGAQVIAEYERIEWEPVARPPQPMHTRELMPGQLQSHGRSRQRARSSAPAITSRRLRSNSSS